MIDQYFALLTSLSLTSSSYMPKSYVRTLAVDTTMFRDRLRNGWIDFFYRQARRFLLFGRTANGLGPQRVPQRAGRSRVPFHVLLRRGQGLGSSVRAVPRSRYRRIQDTVPGRFRIPAQHDHCESFVHQQNIVCFQVA